MKKSLEFFQLGSEVVRYHTVATLVKETVGHHSHGVAMMCLLLEPTASHRLLISALTHDLAEHVTGDIPSPAKRLYCIGDQVSHLEHELIVGAGLPNIFLNEEERRVLKLADIAQGALFCSREISLGNRNMVKVLDRYLSYAEELNPVGRERELFNIIEEMAK